MKFLVFSLLVFSLLIVFSHGRTRCSRSRRCLNGGICQSKEAKCFCPPTYFGELCENYNECHPNCSVDKLCIRRNNITVCDKLECAKSADIIFALDSSGSITQKDFRIMLDMVERFINHYEVGVDTVNFGIFLFHDYIRRKFFKLSGSKDKASVLKAVESFISEHRGGGTRTDKALKFIREVMFNKDEGERETAPNIAIILTDGQSNKPNLTEVEANLMKDTDINVIAIGIGDDIDMKELELIATYKKNAIHTDFAHLLSITDNLVDRACNVTVSPCHSNPCKNGGSCRHFLTGYICDCVEPFVGVNCETKCIISADIMIAIDESGSMTKPYFDKIINAVELIIKILDISSGRVRVGMITFSTNIIVHFDLDAFDNKLNMLFTVNLLRYQYKGGATFTHRALQYLRRFSFTAHRGDRLKYPNYVLIFTDSKSRYPVRTREEAEALHKTGAAVYAIGVGRRVDRKELFYLASEPKKHHMILSSFIRLELELKQTLTQVCQDLEPKSACLKCEEKCKCPPAMKCCSGCCQDTVTLLICPTCEPKYQCGTSKDCIWPRVVCWRGCCETHGYIKRESARLCRISDNCECGYKCCRGICRKPITVEVGCMESKICQKYPAYRSCGEGMKCCDRCENANYVSLIQNP